MLDARAQAVPWSLTGGQSAWVVDGLLADPQAWIDEAAQGRESFRAREDNFYPGLEWALDDELVRPLADWFLLHLRSAFSTRRVLRARGRLSLATLQPHELSPLQRLCHRDRFGLPERDGLIVACTLYLFHDPLLGGTGFYAPRRPLPEIDAAIERWQSMTGEAFTAETGLAPAYQTRSNPWFEWIGTVPARHNRAVFYDGALFHSAHLEYPERLSADPRTGRLTVNLFFTCRRMAA